MQIQINFGDVQSSATLNERVNSELESTLKLFKDRITRVEVHLRDDNGPKSGVDKRCLLEARLAGLDPLAVESRGSDLYAAITDAAKKLERAIRHKVERHDEHLKKR